MTTTGRWSRLFLISCVFSPAFEHRFLFLHLAFPCKTEAARKVCSTKATRLKNKCRFHHSQIYTSDAPNVFESRTQVARRDVIALHADLKSYTLGVGSLRPAHPLLSHFDVPGRIRHGSRAAMVAQRAAMDGRRSVFDTNAQLWWSLYVSVRVA